MPNLAVILYFVISASASGLSPANLRVNNVNGLTPIQEPLEPVTPLRTCVDNPTGPIDTTLCDYENVESVNDELLENLGQLVQLPFFKYLQIDIYRGCPFWQDEAGQCTESTCSIITNVDESEIPEEWKSKTLGKVTPIEVTDNVHELDGCYYKDTDFCLLEDPILGEYYDLTTIPERYTGYTGASPHQIWRAIYEENCFTSDFQSSRAGAFEEKRTETCLEEKVYNKVISGLHASISTHICLDHLNQDTGEWGPNLQCYLNRVSSHPERLEYIYFNTVLILRAISRMIPHLDQYDYLLGTDNRSDSETIAVETKRALDQVVDIARQVGKFDEREMFRGDDAIALKEQFKFHFRNISRIMDCIECDQCRVWGKVQTTGIAAALKILFELDDRVFGLDFGFTPESEASVELNTVVQRSELAAMFNTLKRFSESVQAARTFREMWLDARPEDVDEDKDSQASHSGDTGSDRTVLNIDAHKNSQSISSYCKDSAKDCVEGAVRLWTKGLRSLEAFMNGESKRNESELSLKTEL